MKRPILLLLLSCAVTSFQPAAAQTGSPCTYERCALQLEPGFLGSRIAAGSDLRTVGYLGLRGIGQPSLREAFGGYEPALVHLRRYRRFSSYAGWTQLGALSLFTAGLWTSNEGVQAGAYTGATALLGLTIRFRLASGASLQSAFWTYNGQFAR